jgi:hypothetical protein
MLLYGDCKKDRPSPHEIQQALHGSFEYYPIGVGKVLLDGRDAEGGFVGGS